ncbi:hypothetical protein [Argonema antarcticum]|uniref:hypothetical protein n=1 Tax=Argonema antarcticum TaxID=2942763 RepID=UPI002013AA6F|nr:hypothetical protein [Argonema antarcticum]MCL1475565.1 hypothetical protein [Argonema antarcticum A004/B2]
MSSKQSQLVFLTTTSLFILTSQSSFGFSINGPRTTSALSYTRTSDGSDGTVATYNIVEELLPPSNSSDFMITLKNQFPGWNFDNDPTNILTGSFDIQTYRPCLGITGSTGCAVSAITPPDVAGAFLNLKYTAGTGDPSLARGNKIHWIQRIFNNYDISAGYGNNQNTIDTQLPDNPYYDSIYPFFNDPSLKPDVFRDTVTRRIFPVPSPSDIRWQAELYLVEETATKMVEGKIVGDVKIYNGITWGWTNTLTPKPTKTYSDSLSSGYEVDNFTLNGLTPGSKYYAWTKNDLPSNSCNPNTYLSAYNNKSILTNYDNDSSLVGDGFASALTGIVGGDGIINLDVRSANVGHRGEDKGNYELNVKVYSPEESPPELIVGGSGGGGVSRERPGGTQQTPILPNRSDGNWQVFSNVPGCRWYDPHTTHGFEFQALENTLFTEILDFPVGLDNRFTVRVGDAILGEFGLGDSLDFVSLLGQGVSHFKITDIDSLIGETESTAFPIQLAFNQSVGSFQMRAIEETPDPKKLPEPTAILGLLMLVDGEYSKDRKSERINSRETSIQISVCPQHHSHQSLGE